MAPSCELKVQIDRTRNGGTFTNYDVIEGWVKLTVNSDVSINYIQVKLEGISKTVLTVPQFNAKGKQRKDKVVIDIHKMLYDTSLVFPPPNIKKVSNSKEFTLSPGNYEYPFSFTIPLNSACSKINGVTNRLQYINNSVEFINSHSSNHIRTQLPPSLSGLNDTASVKYFIKATCKRASLLKPNLRSFDPFIFLPLDLSAHKNDARTSFIRKEIIFKDKIPEIVAVPPSPSRPRDEKKRGLLSRMFFGDEDNNSPSNVIRYQKPKVKPIDLSFFLEVRFRYPVYLIPTKLPNYKIYLVTKHSPEQFMLTNIGSRDSSGLGVIYLQNIVIELEVITKVLSQGNKSVLTSKELICENYYQNYKIDLVECQASKLVDPKTNAPLHQFELPSKLINNAVLPDHLSPSFKTCNITRKYALKITCGISSEKVTLQEKNKIKFITLETDVKLLGGLSMTSSMHQILKQPSFNRNDSNQESESAGSSINNSNKSQFSQTVEAMESDLPTYDDVIRETSYQNDSEHYNARRRYQQHEEYYTNSDD